MPTYTYRAKDEYGRTVKGTLAAADEDQLALQLDRMNMVLLKASPTKERVPITLERITRKDLITFTLHLATLISTGVPILQGLDDLIEQTRKLRFKAVIEDVKRNIQAGAALSEALARHPKVFSELYVSIVRAGETTGNLDGSLRDLVKFLEWQEELVANIRQATIYPIFVLTAVTSLIVLLMTFVFPRFTVIFEKTNVPLPLPTRVVMGASHFFTGYWPYILIGLISVIVLYRLIVRNPKGRYMVDRLKLRLPIFGELIRKIELSRFSHYLEALFRAGVEITRALWIVERVVGNVVIGRVIRQARDRVMGGESMAQALRESREFPPLVVRMIGIGESTGAMEETLDKISQYYDREVPATIRKVFAIVEPLTIVFLACAVLGMALSMFLPLYKMLSLVGK